MTTMAVAQRPRRLSHTIAQWGIVLGIIGAFVGFVVGAQIGEHLVPADANSNNSNAALIIGYLGSAFGFLAGMGFFNYPVARLLGLRRPSPEDEAFLYGEEGGWKRYFRLNIDHKVIGVQYIIIILFFLFAGGLGAMFIRAELLQTDPQPPRLSPTSPLSGCTA